MPLKFNQSFWKSKYFSLPVILYLMFSALISLFFMHLCFSNVKQLFIFCDFTWMKLCSVAVFISFFKKRKDEGETDYWSMIKMVHGMKLPSLILFSFYLIWVHF